MIILEKINCPWNIVSDQSVTLERCNQCKLRFGEITDI